MLGFGCWWRYATLLDDELSVPDGVPLRSYVLPTSGGQMSQKMDWRTRPT